jgi:hypothetical protein
VDIGGIRDCRASLNCLLQGGLLQDGLLQN